MKLKELREHYLNTTTKTSKILRYMGAIGIALIWILSENANHILNGGIKNILAMIIFSLLIDYIQYFYKSIYLTIYYKINEDKDEKDIRLNRNIVNVTHILFISKNLLMIAAYLFMLF